MVNCLSTPIQPMANAAIRVVDPVTLEDVRVGERGEVLIGGEHVMRRYWRNPEATVRAVTDGWLRAGDGGSIDADGYLFFRDRLKDLCPVGVAFVEALPLNASGKLLKRRLWEQYAAGQ